MNATRKMLLALAGSGALAGLVFCLTQEPGGTSAPHQAVAREAAAVAPAAEATASTDDSALAEALAQADLGRRAAMLEAWAQSVEGKDAPSVLEQIGTMGGINSALKQEARGALLKSWCGRDLQSAVTWFCRRGGADALQQQARDLVASSMAENEPAARLTWMREALPSPARSELLGPFFRQWTKIDPAAAAGQLRELTEAPAGAANDPAWRDLLGEVAAQWASADLDRAVNWAQALPEGADKSAALRRIAPHWTDVSPQAAAAYAANAGDPALLEAVAGQWAAHDPTRAAAWASGLPAGPDRDGAIARAATIWAENDPSAAAAYVGRLASGSDLGQAAAAVVSMWATSDPAQAAQWVSQFSEGKARQQAMGALISAWVGSDAARAAAYLQALPSGASRDTAIDAFGGAIYTSHPDEAFRWEQSISQQPLREQGLLRTARYWLREDPSKATAEIEQSNLPPGLKSELLSDSGS